jgi:hypothetical protein
MCHKQRWGGAEERHHWGAHVLQSSHEGQLHDTPQAHIKCLMDDDGFTPDSPAGQVDQIFRLCCIVVRQMRPLGLMNSASPTACLQGFSAAACPGGALMHIKVPEASACGGCQQVQRAIPDCSGPCTTCLQIVGGVGGEGDKAAVPCMLGGNGSSSKNDDDGLIDKIGCA